MIRITKSETVPASLQKEGNNIYNGEDVVKQLKIDHNKKCYLCECKPVAYYEIEHLCPQSVCPDLVATWTNLFFSCKYCNDKKKKRILDPTKHNVEDIITSTIRFEKKQVVFESNQNDAEFLATIELLKSIFNGLKLERKEREKSHFEVFEERMLHFLSCIEQYVECKDPVIAKAAIIDELSIDAEFLSFKYHMIRRNAHLYADFREYMIWNKDSGNAPN